MAKHSRIEQIKVFLEKTPNDAFLLYALAIEYVGLGQDQKALGIFLDLKENQAAYFATYYHLAKLYERQGELEKAEKTYEEGIAMTQKLNETFALRELRAALDELTYD